MVQSRSNDVLIVDRNDPRTCRLLSCEVQTPQPGEALLHIEKFGLSSNNVTYLALGDSMSYQEFFPAPDPGLVSRWCCPPVWGVARVLESATEELRGEERIYGFFPAAKFINLRPAAQSHSGFSVERPHIPDRFSLYNHYSLSTRDPFFSIGQEELMVVMRPLFLTGLLLADYLASIECGGASRLLVSSSASKTAYGFVHAMRNAAEVEILGLASEDGCGTADSFGLYDQVVPYQELESIDCNRPVTYVDVSGSIPIRERVDRHFAEHLRRVVAVGLTHWTEGTYGGAVPRVSAPSEIFFAPTWSEKRIGNDGSAFVTKLMDGWNAQLRDAAEQFQLNHVQGPDALEASWRDLAHGRVNPSLALVHSL